MAAAPNPHAALLAKADKAVAHLQTQVNNARAQNAADAAAQWQNYLSHVQQLMGQVPSGDPNVVEQLHQCVDQLNL